MVPMCVRIVLVVSLAAAVGPLWADQGFEAEYESVKKEAGTDSFVPHLLALDQKYADKLALKVDLGAYYLARGATDQALAYLTRGEALAAWNFDEGLKSVLWADLALAHLQKGDPEKAVQYATRSLQYKDEKLGVVFTRARAYVAQGKMKEALADFQTGWTTKKTTMNAQDYGLFARTLVNDKQYAKALEVLEAYRDTLPYELGTGLVESVCYENLGRYDESVLAAFVDVLFQLSRGLVPASRVLENLKVLEAKLQKTDLAPEKSGLTTLRAVQALSQGNWKAVDFDDQLLAASPDARFIKLAALLQGGSVGDADLQAYASLERRFHDFPTYYLSLIHYFRDVRKDVRNPGFVSLAEKVVNLAPQGPAALVGRQALAAGYGLPNDQAPALLTLAEVDRSLAQGSLGPILRLWSLADNPSSDYALRRLQSMAADPGVRRVLTKELDSATGRAKERLNLVLQTR